MVILATLSAPMALGAASNLEWYPPSYNFGSIPYQSGPSEPHEFTLTNTGGSQVVIKNWRYRYAEAWPGAGNPFSSPAETSSPCGHSLEPGESCLIELVFDPLHPGSWWSTVRVRGEGEELWAELPVTGEGAGPWVPVTPGHLAFESTTVGMTTAPQSVTIENQDPEALTIEGISTTQVGSWPPSSTPFKIVGGTCHQGQSIEPGKTCTIEVVMAPTASGFLQSKLEVTDNAPDSPQSIDLEGTATAASADGQRAISTRIPTIPHAHSKQACPKGKRKVVKKGRRICVKAHRHRRHPAHAAR